MRRYLILLAVLLTLLVLAFAFGVVAPLLTAALPPTPSNPSTRNWAGLPQPTLARSTAGQSWANPLPVRDVLAHNGLLWAATGGGLLVWDVTTADHVHFRAEHGLPSHELTAVAADAHGRIWVGSAGAGVAQYDGRAWQIFTTTTGLPSDTIHDLALTPAGELLAGTAAGLAQFDPARQRWQATGRTVWQIAPLPIRAILPLGPELWLATPQGIEWTDGRTWRTFTTADGLPSHDITALAHTAEGVWAGTTEGLAWWDGATWQAIPTLRHPVLALATAADGTLWVGNATGTSQLVSSAAVPAFFPLAGETFLREVQAIAPSAEGVWLGTDSGVYWLSATGASHTLALPSAPSPTTGFYETDGQLWLTTAEALYQFDGANWNLIPALNERPIHQLTAFGIDSAGGLVAVFNTPAQGLFQRPRGGDWAERSCATSAEGHIYGSTVRGVRWSASGVGWLIAHDGLFRLTPQGAGWRCDFVTAAGYRPPNQMAVWGETLYFLQEGVLWQATASGLAPVAAPTAAWVALTLGQDGALWLASPTALARHDGQGWREFAVDWPLPATAVIRQLAVQDGLNLWLATDVGLVQYAHGRWHWLTTADGLPSNNITHLHLAADGGVWLATAAGIVRR